MAGLHSADIAYILEALPIDRRLLVWDIVKADRNGEILIEVSAAVRESLIATMSRDELREAAEQLDADEIADLSPDLPQAVMRDIFKSLSIEKREQLRAAMSYPEDAVGAMMDFDMATIRDDVTLEVVLRYLRHFDELPDHTDQLFVVDRDNIFKGVLPINLLLLNEPKMKVAALMVADIIKLQPDEKAEQAAQAFEHYDLVSAPVVDEEGKLLGRVTVNTVMDYIRSESDSDVLNLSGLREEEDIFASVWNSVKNRWLWLALNLCATFFASRVIGSFENTIEKYRRARHANAHRRGHRRQLRKPDHHDHNSFAGAGTDHHAQCMETDRQRAHYRRTQRPGMGRSGWIVRLFPVPQHLARTGSDRCDGA